MYGIGEMSRVTLPFTFFVLFAPFVYVLFVSWRFPMI